MSDQVRERKIVFRDERKSSARLFVTFISQTLRDDNKIQNLKIITILISFFPSCMRDHVYRYKYSLMYEASKIKLKTVLSFKIDSQFYI